MVPFLAVAREFYLLQSVQIGSMAQSAASRGVQEDNSVAVKRQGRDALVYFPVCETENKIMRHNVEYIMSSSGENSTMIGE